MSPKFLVFCKNDPSKTFFAHSVDGLVFDDGDDIEIHTKEKGRVFKKASGKKAKAVKQSDIDAVVV